MNKKYPFYSRKGVPFGGITNLRPETKTYIETVKRTLETGQ